MPYHISQSPTWFISEKIYKLGNAQVQCFFIHVSPKPASPNSTLGSMEFVPGKAVSLAFQSVGWSCDKVCLVRRYGAPISEISPKLEMAWDFAPVFCIRFAPPSWRAGTFQASWVTDACPFDGNPRIQLFHSKSPGEVENIASLHTKGHYTVHDVVKELHNE